MARIVGGIGTSHTPTIGFAYDTNKQQDSDWAPIFQAYEPIKKWLEEKQVDVIFTIYNDHITSFFFDHYSAFALGVGAEHQGADEGGGPQKIQPIPGHTALAKHIGESMMQEEFDLSFFHHRPLDHGCFSPLRVLFDPKDGWPISMVPLQVGVLQNPVPTPRRCWKFGRALRRAIESYPEDINVAIIGTGGLSHQVHGERNGFNNEEWDQQFMDLLVNDPEVLLGLTQADYAYLGGWEGSEIVMWLIMRAALSANVEELARSYYLPSMTGIATLLLENYPVADIERCPANAPELAPPNSNPFDLNVSVEHYELNSFFHSLIEPDFRERFLADEEAVLKAANLSDEEKDLIRDRDWHGLVNAGAIFFGLEKFAAVLGLSNLDVYAAMRKQSLEEFLATRNKPGAVYSVGTKV